MAVRDVFVSIIDLIEWARSGRTSSRVQNFASLEKLREYSKRTGKISHLRGDDHGNIVLRHLL